MRTKKLTTEYKISQLVLPLGYLIGSYTSIL